MKEPMRHVDDKGDLAYRFVHERPDLCEAYGCSSERCYWERKQPPSQVDHDVAVLRAFAEGEHDPETLATLARAAGALIAQGEDGTESAQRDSDAILSYAVEAGPL